MNDIEDTKYYESIKDNPTKLAEYRAEIIKREEEARQAYLLKNRQNFRRYLDNLSDERRKEVHREKKRKYMEKLRKDPVRLAAFKQQRSIASKKRRERIKNQKKELLDKISKDIEIAENKE